MAWWITVSITVAAMLAFVPSPRAGKQVLSVLVPSVALLASLAGLRRSWVPRRAFALFALSLAAVVVVTLALVLPGRGTFTSFAQTLALPGYGLTIAGLVLLRRARTGVPVASMALDSVLVTVAAGFVTWQLVVLPSVQEATPSRVAAAMSGPLLDLVMVYVGVTLVVSTRGRNLCAWALLLSTAMLLVGDAAFARQAADGVFLLDSPVVLWWMGSFGALGAAMVHPSAGAVTAPGHGDISPTVWAGVVWLSLAAIPGTTAVALRIGAPINVPAAAGIGVIAATLVAVRLGGLLRRLQRSARSDPLTGLQNRASALEVVERLNARHPPAPFALLYADLDGFKRVNDVFGHEAGDLLLCELTRRWSTLLREGDTLARLGGDEFLVVVPRVRDRSAARELARRMVEACALPVDVGVGSVVVSVSVGVRLVTEAAPSAEQVLRDADQAMYATKRAGTANRIPSAERNWSARSA